MIKSNKSGEIERLARLVTIQKLLHDPKPLGAQTRGKYSKENQKDKTLGHMWLSSLAVCVLFVVFVGICWWPTGSGSERIPAIYQSYLLKLSPCMWYVKSNRTVELGLLITTYSVGALKSHFTCVCGDCVWIQFDKEQQDSETRGAHSIPSVKHMDRWWASPIPVHIWCACGWKSKNYMESKA